MLSAPTKLIARLLMAMQVLMTLDIATKEQTKMLSVALPITSKPIESTAENLAWEAWLMLPPEQKNQIKSRKVTPKSIFSLPQRKPCQQGHHKVDTKCIPIINGSNALLIDPSVLILVVGDTGEAVEFDYDLIEEEEEEKEKEQRTSSTSQKLIDSRQGLDKPTTDATEQKLTKQDEPLKFNIFQSKFPTDYDINDDYLNLSNEAVASTTIETTEDQFGSTTDTLRNRSILRTGIDLRNEASNISETQTSVVIPFSSTPRNTDSLALSAENLEQEKPVNETFIEDDSSVHLIAEDEISAPSQKMPDQYNQQKDDIVDDDVTQIDIVEMLKKEAFMPLLNNTQISSESHPTIIAHGENNLNSSLTTEQVHVSKDGFSLNLDVEEITTLPSIFVESDADIGGKYRKKTDCIRSVSTKTTNFESSSVDVVATTTSKGDKKEFMPGQLKDPYNDLKKSKVEPVELMPAQATAATTTMEDLITAETATETETSSAETVTPLLTIRNENNNDRFYYENFTKQDLKTTLTTMMTTKQGSNSSSDETIIAATTPLNTVTSTLRTPSEIDLTKELHLVNELVKGNQQQQNFTLTEQNKTKSKTTTKATATTTTTTTTRTATIKSIAEITTWDKIALYSSTSSTIVDDSSKQQADITKNSLSTTTSTITPEWQGIKAPSNVETQKNFEELAFPSNAQRIESESLIDISDLRTDYLSTEASSSPTPTVKISENRSHRNSKIIRTKTFKTFISTVRPTLATEIAAAVAAAATATTTATTATTTTTTTNDNNNNNSLEPYWWPPIPWYVDKSTTSKQTENQAKTNTVESSEKEEDEPLLLRFWSTYHSPNRFKN
uniref:FOG_N domain-containing protein n=1 Tax=Glossina austeni TaxID=7395 RepID=A0A1A9UUL9_GLOAU